MRTLSRRRLLRAGGALAVAGLLPHRAVATSDHSSPSLEKYVQTLPIPDERSPDGTRRGADYHEVQLKAAPHQFHPDLGETTIWGFDGQFPGPIIAGRRGKRLAVRFDNSRLPEEHLFEVDERVAGTTPANYVGYDGAVPEVRTSTHVHGLAVKPEHDGQADMWTSPDGVTGPRYDSSLRMLPNRQSRLTSTYHDHTRGISRLNNYAGLVGPYYIRSRREERLDLPSGDYDVPLVLADRSFTDDGSLYYPSSFVADVAGDVATVNGAAWPYFEVEPRRYRFRIVNVSNARTYDLDLENDAGDDHDHDHDTDHAAGDVPTLYQVSAGHGFLDRVVSIGHDGDLESLVLAPFERADVIVDFSEHAGETITVKNHAEFPYAGGMDHSDGMEMESMDGSDDEMDHGGGHPQLHEIMQFRVAGSVYQPDFSADPTDLRLPSTARPNPDAAERTRTITMAMGEDEHGLTIHTLNDRRWDDPIEIQPQLGTTEVWELVNDDHHTHPIHLHLVEFAVVDRERHGGSEHADGEHEPTGQVGPYPNERGGKDVVRVDPGETVRIAVEFEEFTGRYPFHCHVLEHEEHAMMRPFEVVDGDSDDESTCDDVRTGFHSNRL